MESKTEKILNTTEVQDSLAYSKENPIIVKNDTKVEKDEIVQIKIKSHNKLENLPSKNQKKLDQIETQKHSSLISSHTRNNTNNEVNLEKKKIKSETSQNKVYSEKTEKSEIKPPHVENNLLEEIKSEKLRNEDENIIKNNISVKNKESMVGIIKNKRNPENNKDKTPEGKNTVESDIPHNLNENLNSKSIRTIQNHEDKNINNDIKDEDKTNSFEVKMQPVENFKFDEEVVNKYSKEINDNNTSNTNHQEMSTSSFQLYLLKIENNYKQIQKVFFYYLTICHFNVAKFLPYPYDLLFFMLVGYFIGKFIFFPKKKSNFNISLILLKF